MVAAKSDTAHTDKSGTFDTSFSSTKVLWRQYVSPQIGVFDFTGTTFSFIVRGIKGHSAVTGLLTVSLRLYHVGGTFDTLKAIATYDSSGFPTGTAETRMASAIALASVSSQNNDRIVCEVGGTISVSLDGANRTLIERFGDSVAAADFASSGQTQDRCPWLEFSGTLPAPSAGGAVNSGFFGLM